MPFQKGVSGNPKGRPRKGWTWAEELLKAVQQKEKASGKRFKQLVSESIVSEASKGNIFAAKELFNRMEGMPKQETDITTDGKPLVILDTHPHGND